MKKLKLLFIMLAGTLFLQAQTNDFQISALVLTANYQVNVPYYPVTVIDSSQGVFGSGATATYNYLTDSTGQFTDSITTVGATGTLWFIAPDSCGFTTIAIGYSANSPSTLATAGLVLCNNIVNTGGNCNYTVSALPVAGFPNQAFFTYSGQGGTSYLWDFGDGNTSTQATSFHTYAQPGTYYYCLTIDSCTPVCDSITVSGSGGCDPFFVPVVNGNTVDIYPALLTGQFVAIVDWGDSQVDTFTPQNIPPLPATISHTYAAAGTYSICLTHSNATLGCSNTHCATVSVGSSNCNFSISAGQTALSTYVFNSTYQGSALSNYLWSFGDGTTATTSNPFHTYTQAGTYVYCLQVDSCTVVCDTLVVTNSFGCNGNFSHQVNGPIVTINPVAVGSQGTLLFNWGDGWIDTVNASALPIVPYNHTYAAPGPYTICVTHSSSIPGCTDTYCDSVVITNNTPLLCNAQFVVDTVNSQPGTVVLWNTSNVTGGSPNGTVVNHFWDFGDGTTSSLAFPTHQYQNAGTYLVCLTLSAIDYTGAFPVMCQSTYCDTLTVDQNGNIIYKGALIGWTLVVLDPATIGLEEDVFNGFNIYPNPADNVMMINVPDQAENVSMTMLNMAGQQVRNERLNAGSENQIDIHELTAGMYFIQIQSNEQVRTYKLIKH